MIAYTPVGGTNDWDPFSDELKWWREGSPFSRFMHREGYRHNRPDRPFWSTSLDGWWGSGHRVWRTGAGHLAAYLASIPHEDRNVISLSHGGNVTAYALSLYNLEIQSWVSVSTPIRGDMQDAYDLALPKVGAFTHVYSAGLLRDRWQLLGALMDKSLRYKRTMTVKGILVENRGIESIGHSDLVRDPEKFPIWRTNGLLPRIGPRHLTEL